MAKYRNCFSNTCQPLKVRNKNDNSKIKDFGFGSFTIAERNIDRSEMTSPNGNEDFQKPCLHLLLGHLNLNKSWKSLRYDNLDLRYKKDIF